MAMIFFSALPPLLMQPDIGGMLLLAVICGNQVENQDGATLDYWYWGYISPFPY